MPPFRKNWPLLGRWIAGAMLGIAIAGLLTYAWGKRSVGSSISVTSKLPDTTTVGAAVQNLPPPNLLKPATPEEAVKENSKRPFVSRADTPASRFVIKADGAHRERALTCLTQAVYYEAASEGTDGGRAVAQVVLNRLRHPGYPASVCGVVYQGSDRPTGCQFTFTCDGSLLRPHVQSLWLRSQQIAKDAISGHVFAPVGHATHYHADYVLPYWADSLDKTVQIGRHIFYRLRGSVGDGRAFFQRYAGSEPPIPSPKLPSLPVPLGTDLQQQQLAKVLVGEDSKGTAPVAEKIAVAAVPLLADANAGKLVIDPSPHAPRKTKRTAPECTSPSGPKQVSRLQADDLRSSLNSPSC